MEKKEQPPSLQQSPPPLWLEPRKHCGVWGGNSRSGVMGQVTSSAHTFPPAIALPSGCSHSTLPAITPIQIRIESPPAAPLAQLCKTGFSQMI